MKKSRLAVLALAIVAAGGAYVLATSPKPAPLQTVAPVAAPLPTAEVLVASKDLNLGTIVSDGELSWQPWPKGDVANGMIVRADNPKAMEDIGGSIVRAAIFEGEPIHREKLVKGTNSGFMSAILPSGMRAVAINIDSQGSTTAGGFILPNDRVDVVRTFHDDTVKGANANAFVSETLLHNVRVLAIGQNVQEKNGQPVVVGSNATLELDPVQSETIILAQRLGQLSLTLRSMLDADKAADPEAPKPDKDVTVVRFGYAGEGAVR